MHSRKPPPIVAFYCVCHTRQYISGEFLLPFHFCWLYHELEFLVASLNATTDSKSVEKRYLM